MEASILHVDADAFFASVEQLLEPSYRGKPLIVGGNRRGVVASASYEARRYGIHSAMPIYKARQLCPHALFIKGHYRMYKRFSKKIFHILQQYTPTIEMTSIDEGYLDLHGTTLMHKANYPQIASRLLQHVQRETGLTLSGGLSTSKLVSKICSSQFKPRQLTWIMPGYEKAFLNAFPLQVMPGVGRKTRARLEALGLRTMGDLAAMPFEAVWELMGGHGIILWERAQGIDRRSVSTQPYRRKSISEERTFPIDIESQDLLIQEAKAILKSICFRLRKKKLYARTVVLKIRYSNFLTRTHQKTVEQASQCEHDFWPSLKHLFKKRDLTQPVRLIGVGLNKLQDDVQLTLFEELRGLSDPEGKTLNENPTALQDFVETTPEESDRTSGIEPAPSPEVQSHTKLNRKKLQSALDQLRQRYGLDVI